MIDKNEQEVVNTLRELFVERAALEERVREIEVDIDILSYALEGMRGGGEEIELSTSSILKKMEELDKKL